MNSSLVYLILILAAVALVPLASAFYRDWDYKRQISGKKKMRTLKDGKIIPMADISGKNMQEGLLKFEADIKQKEMVMQYRQFR